MTRQLTEQGNECIEGTIQIAFCPGQKQTAIHIPFCPPLSEKPKVQCEPAEDVPIRFKVALARPYGMRIEAKRTGEIDAECSVQVRFSAVAAVNRPDATPLVVGSKQ